MFLKQQSKPKTEQEKMKEMRSMESPLSSVEETLAKRAARRMAEKGAPNPQPRPSTGSPMMEGAVKSLVPAMAKGIPSGSKKK